MAVKRHKHNTNDICVFPEKVFQVEVARSPCRLGASTAKLYVLGSRLCITTAIPPRIAASWHLTELRRYGCVDGGSKFVLEAGSRCGKSKHFVCSVMYWYNSSVRGLLEAR